MTECWQHPAVRAMTECPKCGAVKSVGLLLCWPCHGAEKRRHDGGYSPAVEALLNVLDPPRNQGGD